MLSLFHCYSGASILLYGCFLFLQVFGSKSFRYSRLSPDASDFHRKGADGVFPARILPEVLPFILLRQAARQMPKQKEICGDYTIGKEVTP